MPVDPATSAPIPERVGRYEILLPIASGGMATVYLARARGAGGFERDVALKVTHAHLRDSDDFAADLLEEAKLVVRIRHPNVVPVLDADDDPLGVFLAMEYIEGDSLGGLRRRADKAGTRIPPHVGARILIDALAGLHAAHDLKDEEGKPLELVHRDFSPQNILVGIDGQAKLTDFGIAKAASRLGTTQTGLVKGKITYMAPEQARSLTLDRRCDVWAAGVIAWELFAGRRLYPKDNEVATLLKVVSEPPWPLRQVNPAVPPEVEAAVAHALTIDLSKRVVSAQAFARELAEACESSIGLATHEEVARHLDETIGPRLAKRRARVAEIVRLRSQMNQIRRDLPPPTASSPSSPFLHDDIDSSQSGPVLAVTTLDDAGDTATMRPAAPLPSPSAERAEVRVGSQPNLQVPDTVPTFSAGAIGTVTDVTASPAEVPQRPDESTKGGSRERRVLTFFASTAAVMILVGVALMARGAKAPAQGLGASASAATLASASSAPASLAPPPPSVTVTPSAAPAPPSTGATDMELPATSAAPPKTEPRRPPRTWGPRRPSLAASPYGK